MFYGIDTDYRYYTTAVIDSSKKVININHFWKEGLYWFLDHHSPKVLTVNVPLDDRSVAKAKYAVDLIHKLKKNFEYKLAEINDIKEKTENIIIRTSTDLFFRKIVRKELLPIYTREGIEQRIYNLRKTGIFLDKRILSKEKNKLIRELNAIISAFTSWSVINNRYQIVEEEGEKFIIPKYKFVPTTNRIIRRPKEKVND